MCQNSVTGEKKRGEWKAGTHKQADWAGGRIEGQEGRKHRVAQSLGHQRTFQITQASGARGLVFLLIRTKSTLSLRQTRGSKTVGKSDRRNKSLKSPTLKIGATRGLRGPGIFLSSVLGAHLSCSSKRRKPNCS